MNKIVTWLLGTDPTELVGEGNWRLGFVAEYGNYVNLALIAVFLAMAYLIVRSYRREGDNPAPVKVLLSALRIAVIVLVLAVLFRPAVVLRFTRTLYSTVLVLIDDSRSMSFKDRYADANTRSALSGYLSVPPAELATWSRTDIVRAALSRPEGVLGRLAADHPLMLMRFSTDQPGREPYTAALGAITGGPEEHNPSRSTTMPASAPAGVSAALARLRAAGNETDLPAAVRDAIETVQGRRMAGIVVVSDGQMTAQDARGRLADALAYAAQRGIRLYPVLVGDPTPPKNLAVTGLQAPREIRRGAHTEFTVVLAHRNLGGREVEVKLLRRAQDESGWADTGLGKKVVLDGASAGGADPGAAERPARSVQTVSLELEVTETGQFVYRAFVPPGADEQHLEDNAAEAPVQVSDEKIKILLISGDAGWEFQYLRNFLLRQPELYRASIWQQSAGKDVSQLGSSGMKLKQLPEALEELIGSPGGKPHVGYDVIVLYDPQPTLGGFDEGFVKNLRTFVERHHGGLCYIAGNKYSDAVLRSRGPYEPLAAMLPVELNANISHIVERIGKRRPDPWPIKITSYGADHPVTRLGGNAEESARIWSSLPGIFWSHPVVRAKPLARVLAVSSNPMRRTAADEPQPIIVTQAFGTGRVLSLGLDATWRWRFVRDGYYHRLFWSNAIRYLATLQARHVVITAGGDRFATGERITIEAEAYDEKFLPRTTKTLDVEMIDRKTGEARTLTLEAVAGKPGRYKATFKAAATGTFELTALKGDPLAKEKVQSKIIRIELPKAEQARSEADRATMANVASRPENFLQVYETDRLAELIPPERKTAVREVPWELWDSNVTLLLIGLLLTIEWILRKKYNMA